MPAIRKSSGLATRGAAGMYGGCAMVSTDGCAPEALSPIRGTGGTGTPPPVRAQEIFCNPVTRWVP